MAIRGPSRTLPDTYFELVKEFPLAPIRDDDHLYEAREVLDRLLGEHLDEGGRAYLDVLTDLVERHEDRDVPIPDAPESDVLRELMRANGLSQSALARKVGISQSTISAVLNGSRTLTRKQLVTLSGFFNINPSAFLPM